MAFIENGVGCSTSIRSTRAFSIVLKHVHHTIYTRRIETSRLYCVVYGSPKKESGTFRNVVCKL
jgi:hypothetical protein